MTAPRAEPLDAGIGPGPTVVVSRGGQRAAHGVEPALGFAALGANAGEVASVLCFYSALECWSVSRDPACLAGWRIIVQQRSVVG